MHSCVEVVMSPKVIGCGACIVSDRARVNERFEDHEFATQFHNVSIKKKKC
jgi:hypothetical protein